MFYAYAHGDVNQYAAVSNVEISDEVVHSIKDKQVQDQSHPYHHN